MGLFNLLFGSGNASSPTVEPSVNIDGSPMVGSIDINGNPYGVTGSTDIETSNYGFYDNSPESSNFDSFDSGSSGFSDW